MAQQKPTVSFLKLAGPGLVVAATGIGSGDVVSATVGGARYGVVLLWAIVAGAFFKFVLSEGIARWQLATGKTALEGWADHLPPWVKCYFGAYLVLWTVAVSAALTNATGLGIANLTGGAMPQSWGAVAHSLIGFAFVWLGGYGSFEKLMKLLVGVMGFSILLCAGLTLHNPLPMLQGLVIPTIPAGSGTYVLSLIGGVGGSITMLSYNYWMREEGMRGAGFLSYVRGDIAIAYIFTALFGISIMLIANDAFFVQQRDAARCRGGAEDGRGAGHAARHVRPLRVLGRLLGGGVRVAARRLAERAVSLRRLLRHPEQDVARGAQEIVKVTSTPYRLALAFITLVPLPFAFTGRPDRDHRHLHHRRQPVRAVPGGDAALPEQPREVDRSGAAQFVDHQPAAGRDPRAVRHGRRAGSHQRDQVTGRRAVQGSSRACRPCGRPRRPARPPYGQRRPARSRDRRS